MVMAEGGLRQPLENRDGTGAHVARFLGRILLPAVAFLAVGAVAYEARLEPVNLFGALSALGMRFNPGSWFTMGHLWVFALFFVANVTSRRYGAGVAFGGAMLAGLLATGVWAYATYYGGGLPMLPTDMPPMSVTVALASGLALGLAVDIVIFDLVRGIPWWRAPLYAPLLGGAAYIAVYHAALDDVLPGEWSERALMHFGVWVVGVLAMLVGYHVLRPIVRPLPGYGGA